MGSFLDRHFTGEGFRTLATYRHILADELIKAHKRRADYDREVRDWYETGDGRPRSEGGMGHRFPTCMHGTSLWTDYDNICMGCEEGETALREAIGYARERYLRFNTRWEWATDAPGDLDHDTRMGLMRWAASLYPGMEPVALSTTTTLI